MQIFIIMYIQIQGNVKNNNSSDIKKKKTQIVIHLSDIFLVQLVYLGTSCILQPI